MTNKNFIDQLTKQAGEAVKVLKQQQGLLDANFKHNIDVLKKSEPEKAIKLEEFQEKTKEILKQAEKGNFSKVENIIKEVRNEYQGKKKNV